MVNMKKILSIIVILALLIFSSPFVSAKPVFAQDPEMDVQGNSISIPDGDTSPQVADDTDFGDADIGGTPVDHTFTILNTGSANLNLTDSPIVVITGDTADFTVTDQPVSLIEPANQDTFTIQFDPTTTGTRTATISIDNDDADENPYTFAVSGNGITAPEMDVQGGSPTPVSIADGDTSPIEEDGTDFC
jgi:hypothetical protein